MQRKVLVESNLVFYLPLYMVDLFLYHRSTLFAVSEEMESLVAEDPVWPLGELENVGN